MTESSFWFVHRSKLSLSASVVQLKTTFWPDSNVGPWRPAGFTGYVNLVFVLSAAKELRVKLSTKKNEKIFILPMSKVFEHDAETRGKGVGRQWSPAPSTYEFGLLPMRSSSISDIRL